MESGRGTKQNLRILLISVRYFISERDDVTD